MTISLGRIFSTKFLFNCCHLEIKILKSIALQSPHCDTGQCHMHLSSTYSFQYFLAGFFVFHTLKCRRFPFLLVMAQFWHMLQPEPVTECTSLLLQFSESTFDPKPVTVKSDNSQWLQLQVCSRQNALDTVHFNQYKPQFLIQFLSP